MEELDFHGSTPRAFVQEADCSERVIVLKVRVPGKTSLVVVGATRSGGGAGVMSAETRRAIWAARLPGGAGRQRAREEALAGTIVVGIGETSVAIEQDGARRVVRVHGGRVVVTDADPADEIPFVAASAEQLATWEERGLAIAHALADEALELRRAEIARAFDRAEMKIDRRREAIRGDLAKIAQADAIASQAQWLVGEAARAPRGATKLVVTDWSSGEARPLEVPLDPSRSAREQVDAMFKRAKRLRLGARIANDRLGQADAQREGVAFAREMLREAKSLVEIEEAAREAKRAAPRDVSVVAQGEAGAGGGKAKKERTPYRTFFARSGRKILVGKGAKDNDALTLHVARPHDLWLHAKDRPGAHVIVQLDKGTTCPSDDLVDAAHLAAHFSDAREETIVDVQYVDRRHLRKPKGSAPGFVVVDREKVLVLRVAPAILRALLEREEV